MCRQRRDPLLVAEKLEHCCKRFQELELDNCLFIERIAGQNHFIRRVPDQIGRVLSEMIERLHLAAVWALVLGYSEDPRLRTRKGARETDKPERQADSLADSHLCAQRQ